MKGLTMYHTTHGQVKSLKRENGRKIEEGWFCVEGDWDSQKLVIWNFD